MKLISNTPLLSPIVDELLNILYTKLARVMSSSSFCTTRIGFCSSFYPTRIVKYKAGVIWVRYFIVDHAHPTLEFGYWENICMHESTNLQASLYEFWLVLYSTRLSMRHIREREAHTTKHPWSRISGMAPSSLPVIFSRMVVFPAFRRPIISTRNRLHNPLRSSGEMSSMLVSYAKQRNRS